MTSVGIEYTPQESELLEKLHRASVQLEDTKALLRSLRIGIKEWQQNDFHLLYACEEQINVLNRQAGALAMLNDDLLVAFYRKWLRSETAPVSQ